MATTKDQSHRDTGKTRGIKGRDRDRDSKESSKLMFCVFFPVVLASKRRWAGTAEEGKNHFEMSKNEKKKKRKRRKKRKKQKQKNKKIREKENKNKK